MSYPSVHTGDHNTKTTDMQPTENTPTPCQCDICLERASIKAGEAGKANTAPTPTETILSHPVSVAGHRDGGARETPTPPPEKESLLGQE